MVLKGQFLERPTLIPVGTLVLDAVSHRGSRGPLLLVLPPRPEDGGGMDHVVGAELAFAVSAAGHPTLRFNYRGVGASQGKRGQGKALVEDARAALELARDNSPDGAVAVASISGSVEVGLALLDEPNVRGLFAISPTRFDPKDRRVSALAGEASVEPWLRAASAMLDQLTVVGGASHTFQRGLPQVGKAVVEWLGKL